MELNIDHFLSFKIMMLSVLVASFIIVFTVDIQQLITNINRSQIMAPDINFFYLS